MYIYIVRTLQGGQRLEKPGETLKSLELVTGALKTWKNMVFPEKPRKHKKLTQKNLKLKT